MFSHQFLVVPECPTPLLGRDTLTRLGTTLVMGSFSAPRALQLLVTTEEPITPFPIERDQKLWENQINPLNSSTCLQVARLRKSIPTLCPRKRRNSLGNVNSKVGI